MKKIFFSLLVASVAATGTAYAQSYASDAYRFSQSNYGSTSRFKAMGGAQIGVGGDLGSIGANPAGLGLFTKSEFSITPEFNSVDNSNAFLGGNTNSNKSQINLNNIGVVFYSPTYKAKGTNVAKGLISANFGLGFNRNNDFFNNISYQGNNGNSSIRDAFAEQAGSFGTNNSIAGDAYDGYLINYNTPTYPGMYSAEPYNSGNFNQAFNETRLGSTSEFNLAGGLNFSNSFYVGAALSFVDVNYRSEARFSETGIIDVYDEDTEQYSGINKNYNLDKFVNQQTKGSGFNLKLGMIFRPVSELKIGVNLVTPTWLTMQDNTNETLNSAVQDINSRRGSTLYYDFVYNLKTPLKASAGISYVIAKKAIIAADIDYVDYSTMRFTAQYNDNSSTINYNNTFIKENYKAATNYRLGAEIKVSNDFSLRGGYAVNGSGIKGGNDKFYQTQIVSGGLGYRVNNIYFDATYLSAKSNFSSAPYELSDYTEPVADIKNTRNNVFLTVGVRF